MPFVGLADMDAHQGALAFKFFVRHGDSVTSDRPLVSRWFCINHSLIYTVFYLVDNCVWECRSVLPFFFAQQVRLPQNNQNRLSFHLSTPCSQVVGQPNASNAEQQAGNDARRDVGCGACPLAVFQHLGSFPAEAGERGVAAKKADGDGHAPIRRDYHAVQRELSDQAEKKASCQINEQCAIGKSAPRADLHEALQAVAGQCASGAKNCDQRETQILSNPQPVRERRQMTRAFTNKKLLARSCQESSAPAKVSGAVMANSIAIRISLQFSTFSHCRKANSIA